MGALTLKSFPFELRGWEVEKFQSIDPTDGFGTNTRVYISKQQIVQIEVNQSKHILNAWLSDKGRQFFDGIFSSFNTKLRKKKYIKKLFKTLYFFEHCTIKIKKACFFTIVFENLAIEMLILLTVVEKNYSFLKLKRAENFNALNDFEFNFQLNTVTNFNKLKLSTFCLIIANNPRYEGYHLNLNLRQRCLKGNFKCLVLGSLIDLTFPNVTVGTNFKLFKNIVQGNHFVCQDFKTSKHPFLIFSNEFCKRLDNQSIINFLKTLRYVNVLSPTWNGLNTLNLSLSETGLQSAASFSTLKKKDFAESSSFYFININVQTINNLKKITEAKLLNYFSIHNKQQLNINKIVLDQNIRNRNNQIFVQNILSSKRCNEYNFLPVKMFYEKEETFINTEGFIKRTNKLIIKKKKNESWKMLRNILKSFKIRYTSLNYTNNNLILFNSPKQYTFITFISFQHWASKNLNSHSISLTVQNQSFFIKKTSINYKQIFSKIQNTKLKYLVDDFFTGGTDEYSKNSMVLSKCSKILRTQSTNFF